MFKVVSKLLNLCLLIDFVMDKFRWLSGIYEASLKEFKESSVRPMESLRELAWVGLRELKSIHEVSSKEPRRV